MKKTGHTKCWWGGGEIGIFIHCWWKCEMVDSLWKTFWQSLKKSDMWDWLSMQPKPGASRTSGTTATKTVGDTLCPSETHHCSPCPGLLPTLPPPETLVSRAHCLPCAREGLEPPGGWIGNQEPRGISVDVFPSQWCFWCPPQESPWPLLIHLEIKQRIHWIYFSWNFSLYMFSTNRVGDRPKVQQ